MPYDLNNPPEKLKNLSASKKRQWIHVYNDAYAAGDSEEKAHKKAWGAVNKDAVVELQSFCSAVEKAGLMSTVRNLVGGKAPKPASTTPPKPGGAPSGASGRRRQIGNTWQNDPNNPGKQVQRTASGKLEYRDTPTQGKPNDAGKPSVKDPKAVELKPDGGAPSAGMKKFEDQYPVERFSGKDAKAVFDKDPKSGEQYVSISSTFNGKPQKARIKLSDVGKLSTTWQKHLTQIAASLPDDWANALLKADQELAYLQTFSKAVSAGTLCKEEEEEEPSECPDEPVVDVSTPAGARAMALGLSRIFGGWKGGCRLSPSANRTNMYHITIMCKTPGALGKRILQLKNHLIRQGYREESEGIFSIGQKKVYQGRSYSRRKGNSPLAFMVTVEDKGN